MADIVGCDINSSVQGYKRFLLAWRDHQFDKLKGWEVFHLKFVLSSPIVSKMGDICTLSISITKLSETIHPFCFVAENNRKLQEHTCFFWRNCFKAHRTKMLYMKCFETYDFIWNKSRVNQCSKHIQQTYNVTYLLEKFLYQNIIVVEKSSLHVKVFIRSCSTIGFKTFQFYIKSWWWRTKSNICFWHLWGLHNKHVISIIFVLI